MPIFALEFKIQNKKPQGAKNIMMLLLDTKTACIEQVFDYFQSFGDYLIASQWLFKFS